MDRVEEGAEHGLPTLPLFGDGVGFNVQAMRWASWPIEYWLQLQADMLRDAADWIARRREGTEAALRALEGLCACRDARDASKIQSGWIEDEAKRLESDMRSLGVAFAWPHEIPGSRSNIAETKIPSR